MTEEQRVAIFKAFADHLALYPTRTTLVSFGVVGSETYSRDEVRHILRAMESDGLTRNVEGAWKLTAAGAVYRYLCQKAEGEEFRQSVRIKIRNLRFLPQFDIYEARHIHASPTELRARQLVDVNGREGIMWLSDVYYPLGELAGWNLSKARP
ncbi:hypothetical protein CcrJ4_gp291 [Caulobacter phage J4]|nr:hypothetical protein CcrJ4_gp291 [Caulobacter phage J4]